MRGNAVRGVKWTALAIWTMICLVVYGILALGGDAIVAHTHFLPMDANGMTFISRLAAALRGLGFALAAVVWLVGAALVMAVGWAAQRAAARSRFH